MSQVMIMVSEAGRMENTCNLPADLDKNGNVLVENDNLHCKSLKYNNKIIGAWRVTRLITRFSLGRGKIKPTRCGLLYQILAYTLQLSA